MSQNPPISRRAFAAGLAGYAVTSTFGPRVAQAQISSQATEAETTQRVAKGARAGVATVHPLASQAAIATFERGGNAVDAAAAASIMLTVVDGFNSGIGGGCLALLRSGSGKVHAIDGRETAPAEAQPEMFFRNGEPAPELSRIGPLAAGVPGLLAALERLTQTHGMLPLREAFESAAHVAETGFRLDANYISRLKSVEESLQRFPSSARVFLDQEGRAWPVGHVLKQPDLAHTLRQLAVHGISWFYQGDFAERTAQFMSEQGGMLSRKDFAAYRAVARQPILSRYRGYQVFGFPPPSSGGIHISQMLEMLSGFDVREIFARSPATGKHLLLEVMKRAMADRAYWLGDADFADVPRGLVDPDYLQARAASIDLQRATQVESHGVPPGANVDLFGRGGHTTHLTTADAEGNVVALTQTINTTFGCKMVVPGTGVVLNNELDDFSIAPGVRNAFGLLGSEANLIAPGKRPLSSMSPTLVLDASGLPYVSCGAAGGPKIITTVLQILVGVLDLGQTIEQAIAAPRIHHQWSPDRAVCEQKIPREVRLTLESLGHDVSVLSSAAVAQGLALLDGRLTTASDPRVPSSAMAL